MSPFSRELLDFWFGPAPHSSRAEWFRKDPAFDATIGARFGGALEAALAGATPPPDGDVFDSLAHVVLLDQFTRNAFRDTPRAFAGDALALATAIAVVDAGRDSLLDRFERLFLYLPFEHSEDLAMQERALALFRRLDSEAADIGQLEWAEKHAAIIRRFGRYPHRNAILGRESTPAEIAFLKEQGSRF
ncbi:MAG TPA: DUF924 family protein [Casimicrobiaceae bacterium]|nr:DUF924 family protein [Casimicrobiaceae bacterium]